MGRFFSLDLLILIWLVGFVLGTGASTTSAFFNMSMNVRDKFSLGFGELAAT